MLGKPPVMCDIVSVSSFTIHLAVMEYHGAGTKSFVLWVVLALSYTFFPALIATLSHAAARGMTTMPPPTAATMCSLARSLEPFLFGLRYSVLATFLGVMPCLDASIVSVLLLKQLGQLSDSLVVKKRFFERCTKVLHLCIIWRQGSHADSAVPRLEGCGPFGCHLVSPRLGGGDRKPPLVDVSNPSSLCPWYFVGEQDCDTSTSRGPSRRYWYPKRLRPIGNDVLWWLGMHARSAPAMSIVGWKEIENNLEKVSLPSQ
jgi:hypothetical protein